MNIHIVVNRTYSVNYLFYFYHSFYAWNASLKGHFRDFALEEFILIN